MAIKACVFDAYGTLFDVAAAARNLAAEPGMEGFAESWQALSELWRQKQLEYTWLRAITGEHCNFWQVTQDALDYAMAAEGLGADRALRARLLALYRTLDAYPEVPAALRALEAAGIPAAILSNGSPDMLADAIASAEIGGLLSAVLSVEAVGQFKPARAVYDLVPAQFGCPPDQVLFVSSNGWDAAGGAGYGFLTAWVNRSGAPMDRLGHPPHEVLADLAMIPTLAEAL